MFHQMIFVLFVLLKDAKLTGGTEMSRARAALPCFSAQCLKPYTIIASTSIHEMTTSEYDAVAHAAAVDAFCAKRLATLTQHDGWLTLCG
jgi:hypothetical protein